MLPLKFMLFLEIMLKYNNVLEKMHKTQNLGLINFNKVPTSNRSKNRILLVIQKPSHISFQLLLPTKNNHNPHF